MIGRGEVLDRLKKGTHHGADGSDPVASGIGKSGRVGFSWSVRVYYEDTDLGGVVYHANYLRFMERARTEWLRTLGFEQDVLREQHGVQFVVVGAKLEFTRPARFNDELKVSVSVKERGRASLVFAQEIRLSAGHTRICSGEMRVACVDIGNFKPCPLPKAILAELDA